MGSLFATVGTGAGLSALLAPVDPSAVLDVDLLELLTAETRQLAHQQARQWAVMAEIATRAPGNHPGAELWDRDDIFEAGVDEIRAELVLTRQGARGEAERAVEVMTRPQLAAALRSGAIDRQRAVVIADGCSDLTPDQAQVLIDTVLPGATEVTVGGLGDRVRRTAIALDPAWAERRYRESLHRRRLIGYLTQDGTATITAQGLPADEAAAACARVVDLADRAKRSGADAPLDHLRTEIFTGLLSGRFDGKHHAQIVAELIQQFPQPAPGPEPEPPAEPEPEAGPATEPPCEPEPAQPGVELRVGLATLLELDERPGEIAGWGAVRASVARATADKQRRAQWRFAVVDENGRLLFDGITRHRPPANGAPAPSVSGGFVELQVPALMLQDPFFAFEHPGWGPLIRDLAAQYAAQAPIEQDPTARFAGRPLRRHSQIEHRTCLFPGCRRPAADCDLDHRHEHGRGGLTVDTNLGPGCRHDHQLKTVGGWRLIKRDAETYVWISPLGGKHVSRIDPVAWPLPDPLPRAQPPEPNWPTDEPPASAHPLRRPDPPPPPARQTIATDPEPPPF